MRFFLICTHNHDIWPVEEVLNEGGFQQSVERHVEKFDELHRDKVRWFCPEMPTDLLSVDEDDRLRRLRHRPLAIAEPQERDAIKLASTIIDLYDATVH